MNLPKTLIGKNSILFLTNDTADELQVHCNNLLKVGDLTLSRYTFTNYIMFVYPNKSLIYKDYLPDEYIFKYRPALDIYKLKFKTNIYDLNEILQFEQDVYYKTDTHINIKGNYIVYKYFIEILNSRLNVNIIPKHIELNIKSCELKTLPYGIGDLTWEHNLGQQVLHDINDNFYYHDECTWFYFSYKIKNDNNIRFLNYELDDNTSNIENKLVDWNIISDHIIYITHLDTTLSFPFSSSTTERYNNDNKIPLKVIIFYDSLLLNVLPLYFDLFNEIYFVKNQYSNDIINKIKPDYVFEFRVERFLF